MISVVLLILLFVSNINLSGIYGSWYADKEIAFISNVSKPPVEAESFYIIDSKKTKDPQYIYQLDAFEIATWYGIKTLNGYSGQFPDGWWSGLWDPCSDVYEEKVSEWITNHSLTNVFAYDRAENIWIPFDQRLRVINKE